MNFNGWINKTGNQVTIENLHYPVGMSMTTSTCCQDFDGDGTESYYDIISLRSDNRPVGKACNDDRDCSIIFHGHGGLTYNADFQLSAEYKYGDYYTDTDGDGIDDSEIRHAFYASHTVTFELPFEPYGFSLSGHQGQQIDRIF